MEWISVKERLPEKESSYASIDCLFCGPNGVEFGYFLSSAQEWYCPGNDGYYKHDFVTHWMPLPNLPGVTP